MSDELVGAETAKAGQELGKFGTKALKLLDKADTLPKAQTFVSNLIGAPIENVVGLLIGDPLLYVRVRMLAFYKERVEKILGERGVKNPQAVSPSIAIPLIESASNETREELRELWAKLLASAMDPARSKHVRLELIDAVKRMAPVDALILKARHENQGLLVPGTIKFLADRLGLDMDDVQVSITNLVNLRLMMNLSGGRDFQHIDAALSPLGRELMRIVA
jgi:Abortive infection alpha